MKPHPVIDCVGKEKLKRISTSVGVPSEESTMDSKHIQPTKYDGALFASDEDVARADSLYDKGKGLFQQVDTILVIFVAGVSSTLLLNCLLIRVSMAKHWNF